VLFSVAVYLGALRSPFVFDDRQWVLDNPSIRDLGNLKWIFIGSRRFLTNFSYAVDWAIWGARPLGFHLTNLLLHIGNVLLLFALARRLLPDGAFGTAAIFAVHPLFTESVVYISSRAGLLCVFFLLLGVFCFQRTFADRKWWIMTLICWPLAAAAKETGLLLPLAWALYDLLFGPRPLGRRVKLVYLPGAILGMAAAAARLFSYRYLEGGFARPVAEQLLTQAEVFWRYVFLFVVPVGQSVVHSVVPVRSLIDPIAWLSVASVVVAIALLISLRGVAALGGFWFLFFLLPSSLVPLAQQMAEHRVYEAGAGAALLAGWLVARRRVILIPVLIALSLVTVLRVRVWASPLSLWEDAAAKAPGEWSAHYALADALREANFCDRAIGEYRAALTLRPNELRVRRNLAICLAAVGEAAQAEAELVETLRAAPGNAALHYDLALVLTQRGQEREGREELKRSLELKPGYPPACAELAKREAPPPSCQMK
jgi:tetratricopeptide (TPR) repeat protein